MAASFLLLVGGYSQYIHSLRFTPSTSSLTYLTQTSVGAGSPSWLTTHPSNSSIVYATQELYSTPGAIHALVLNPSTGSLQLKSSINTQGSTFNAGGAVYVEVFDNGNSLSAANFNGGSAFVVSLGSDKTSFSGSGQTLQFTGSGPLPNQRSAHAHQSVAYNNEILVPDLGSDLVRRLTKSGSTWSQAGSVSFPAGSGPRHVVALNNTLYTLHQNYNALTQHTLPALNSGMSPQLIANLTTVPPDTTSRSGMEAAGLLYAESPSGSSSSPLLYASNRNDPSPSGDAITIFEIAPTLKAVAYVRTGVQHARALAFVGPNKEYIAVGGMNGGGIKVYKRVTASEGYLTQVAAFPAGQIYQPTGFTWV
ncbi:3-carboxy-cis,cis-mucoante lactonizing enzyme [Serendipita vermifera]|nr:3-carboxy-cis,cis-mucoante lactonizing enzyme [Serendipita vermifera]